MNWKQELSSNKSLQDTLSSFLGKFGISGLEQALLFYADMQQDYICKTKRGISKIKLCDILFIEIQGHHITIHTSYGIYQKYGTLKKEQKYLSSYGFTRCSQSCIVSLNKIKAISSNDITLINGTKLHLSNHYAPAVLMAFSRKNNA